MSDPPGGLGGFPFGMDPESLRDAPLFREMQRVMASSSGPINWELARQVGVASAVEAGEDREPTDDERSGFDEAVRVAELHVARFTGLDAPDRRRRGSGDPPGRVDQRERREHEGAAGAGGASACPRR